MNELVKWNNARSAIVEAKSVDEVKGIKDKAEAMRAYAKQVGESLEVQNDICEIKLRAERRMGEMLKEMPKNKGGEHTHKKPTSNIMLPVQPTLKDMGIEKHESSRYQKIAELPEEKFEEIIQETKQEEKELTESLMLETARKIDREVKVQKQKEAIEKGEIDTPTGLYDVISIDPPWKVSNSYSPDHYMGRVANPYPEMDIEEIKDIELPAKDDCILWLWVTQSQIWHIPSILKSWGFEYKCILTWDKESMGIGKWLRKQTEFCVLATKGKPLWTATDFRDILREKRTKHSKKPESFYELVNKYCVGKKLEYFSRKKRDGWDVFGDEVTNE